MTGYDNNTPYDCTLAGEKQGSQEQFGRGATPLRFAKNKKHHDFEVNANSINHTYYFDVI